MRGNVKVKCDFCDAEDMGTKEQLEDRGWNKIFFDDIEQPPITSCWKHRSQAVNKAGDLQRRQLNVTCTISLAM